MSKYQYLHIIGFFKSSYLQFCEERDPVDVIQILDPVVSKISLSKNPDIPIKGIL